jgi:hypothetical protein
MSVTMEVLENKLYSQFQISSTIPMYVHTYMHLSFRKRKGGGQRGHLRRQKAPLSP